MHAEAWAWIEYHARNRAGTTTAVMEQGGRNINGSIRDLFGDVLYTAVDIRPGEGVDVVADSAEHVSPDPVDMVVCAEVLEHTPRGADIVRRAAESLQAGGVYLVTAATHGRPEHSAIDGEFRLHPGEYYGNVSPDAMMQWLREAGFSSWLIELRSAPADIRVVAFK